MKTISKYISFVLLSFVLFTACDERNFDTPPIDAPLYEGKANTTIQQLKEKYLGQNLVEITDTLIIKGTIVANDISGNIYKQIQLQDETAGICIAIDRNNIYGDFRVGQEIFIELKGLYYGLYGNYPQIGYKYSRNNDNVYTIGQVTWELFLEKTHLNGFPDTKKVIAKEFSGIEKLSTTDVGQLVTIHNTYFENGGKEPFAVPNPANGNVQTESKLLKSTTSTMTLIARNSSAANFATHTMPQGVGSITGILSIFNSNMQITLRDSSDYTFRDSETPEPPKPTGNDGSKEKPLTVAEGISKQGTADTLWVKGYIIGAVKTGVTSVQGADDIQFAPPFTSTTNILIADSKTEKDHSKCLIINLPSGKPLRSQVNLQDNPTNIGKELLVKGKLRTYFGLPGSRDNQGSDFELEGSGTNPNPDAILNETLLTQASFDKFTTFSITGEQQWTFSASYGAVMSGFADNKSNANEDWFITPPINLTGKTGAKLSFDHARGPAGSINVGIAEKYYTIWISNNYTSGNPTSATWIEITGINHGTTAWAYTPSGNLSIPTSHLTDNTRIAFKYKCTDTESATWEIKNIIINQ